jgi:hypothetical protein
MGAGQCDAVNSTISTIKLDISLKCCDILWILINEFLKLERSYNSWEHLPLHRMVYCSYNFASFNKTYKKNTSKNRLGIHQTIKHVIL